MQGVIKRTVPYLKQYIKIMLCVVLCICLVFAYSYKKPMQVHAIATISVGSAVLIGLCASALGIGIAYAAGNETVQNMCQSIADGAGDLINNGVYAVQEGGKTVAHVTSELLQYVGDKFKEAWAAQSEVDAYSKQFPYGWSFKDPVLNKTFYEHAFGCTLNSFHAPSVVLQKITFLGFIKMSPTQTMVTTLINGLNVTTKLANSSINSDKQGAYYIMYDKIGTDYTGGVFTYYSSEKNDNPNISSDKMYLFCQVVNGQGSECYAVLEPSYYSANAYTELPSEYYPISDTKPNPIPAGTFPIDNTKFFAQGKSIVNNDTKTVVDALKEKAGVKDAAGNTTIPLTNTGSDTAIDNNTRTQTQEDTIGQDIATDADKAANDASNADRDTSTPKPLDMPDLSLPSLIKSKFPFCLPFDIYTMFVGFYSSEVKAPHWVWPIKLERLGINETIDIDFSPLDPVAAVARFFEGAGAVLGLILITRKMIGAGGD